MNAQERDDLWKAATDEAHFRGLTFSNAKSGERVSARAIFLRGVPCVSVITGDGRKETTRNVMWPEWPAQVAVLLDQEFQFFHVRGTNGDWHVRVTRKGRVLVSHGKPSAVSAAPLAHDREKAQLLTLENSEAFLRCLDVVDEKGATRPSMQAKYRQINGFLRLIEPLFPDCPKGTLQIVDGGCGSAHLTFAVFHFLRHIKGWNVQMTGVDQQADLMRKNQVLAERLGWPDINFVTADLREFQPGAHPYLAMGLHACDLASDVMMSRGVEWKSEVILSAPCCQHELHHQLDVPVLRAITRHGILRERLADVLTDAFRAAMLRLCGYRVGVVEFTTTEYTAKNLLIRAERTQAVSDDAEKEYRALKEFMGVTPEIERLLAPYCLVKDMAGGEV